MTYVNNPKWIHIFKKLFFEESLANFYAFNFAIALKNSNIPYRLFKYRRPNENTLKSLQSLTGWFGPCSEQNDTFEAIGRIDYHGIVSTNRIEDIRLIMPEVDKKMCDIVNEPMLAKIKELQEKIVAYDFKTNLQPSFIVNEFKYFLNMAEEYKNMQNEVLPEKLRKRYSIFSLSEDNLSNQMWSYYADDHKGICIEYDFSELDETEYLKNHLFPIIYSDNIVDITPYLIEAIKNPIYFHNPIFLILPALNKTLRWSHEVEWRIIKTENYNNKGESIKLPKPKAVFLGLRIDEEYKSKINDICLKQGIQLKRLHMNINSRQLEES